jgi:hypothetical protein
MSDRLEIAKLTFTQLNQKERAELLRLFTPPPPAPPATTAASVPRLLRPVEVAGRLGRSVRYVHRLAKEGFLRKVTMPGRKRAAGFRESDLAVLIAGGEGRTA